jgi:hypothetical protein
LPEHSASSHLPQAASGATKQPGHQDVSVLTQVRQLWQECVDEVDNFIGYIFFVEVTCAKQEWQNTLTM